MQDRILEPVGEVAGAAAFAFSRIGLAFAFAGAGRTFDADMEVIVVAVHRPHLVQPAAITLSLAAQRLFDRCRAGPRAPSSPPTCPRARCATICGSASASARCRHPAPPDGWRGR